MSFKPTERRMRRFDPSSSAAERGGEAGRKRFVRTVAAIALTMMIVGGGGAFLLSDFFRAREARVIGNEGIPAQSILAASGVMGQHWFIMNLDQSAQRVRELPGIDATNIRCEWQRECVILVKVSEALARLDGPGGTMWLDATGRAQKTWENARAKVIVKLEDGAVLPGDGKTVTPTLLSNLLELIDAQPAVTQYAFSARDGFSFASGPAGKVRLGTTERAGGMRERALMAQVLREQLAGRNIQPKLIDVRVIEAPYYIK